MKALSLTQPWATLVVTGAKRIETRGWETFYNGPLLIHASKGFPADAVALCRQEPFRSALLEAGINGPGDLPRGAIIGAVRLMGCERIRGYVVSVGGALIPPPEPELSFGDYTPGRYAWVLRDGMRLAEPVPCRGALGLWKGPDLPVVLEHFKAVNCDVVE